ncbi:Multidrug resistance efflux pump-like protein [Thioalkalivibrio sulfidiphilus HL-EbGr7]|uniref:Multidrug resistance efflux pump-like protein n=2 Tax=Thioalkalivibrio TaxID=106633 RepID=B8GUW1_THISH|nr:Multidrug resistance efflux pump-like protein [Thioalkalivibrio sulfidiphilus HL-EbGr7]
MNQNRELPPMPSPSKARRLAALLSALALSLSLTAPSALAQDIPAQLDWAERLELGTPVSGMVTRVNAEPGQRVKRGDVLVQLDDRGLRAYVEEAEAQVKRLELARDEAKLEYERQQEMFDRTLISQRDLSLAQIGFAMADAEFVAAKARLTRARLDLEYSRVRAPFDGLVLARHVRVGQAVNNELQVTPLVTLVSSEPMLARGNVAEDRLARLREGQNMVVRVGEARYEGTLRAIGLEAMDNGFPVTVQFSAPAEHRLRAGLAATLQTGND